MNPTSEGDRLRIAGDYRTAATRATTLCQYFTPEWAATAFVERYFGDLASADRVVEPACGRGAFLKALPAEVPAVGVEIDPALAAEATEETGRPILCGNFRVIDLPWTPTVILGNPPFDLCTIESFLARACALLPNTGRCGFLLPAYAFQTPERVVRWNADWTILAELVPRTLFPGLRLPLVFTLFTRTAPRTLVGFARYREAAEIRTLSGPARLLLARGAPRRGVWRALVETILQELGGEATLAALYARIGPHRPTPNAWWREKVRQTVQHHCRRVGRGGWALAA